MGKPTMSELDRRGMATIRELHAAALRSTRVTRHLRGLSSEDTRLRSLLADMDTTDPVIIDAWAMLVRTILVGRSQRRDLERRSSRTTTGEERSLRQQFVEQGFDDELVHRSRLRSSLRSRLYNAASRSSAAEPYMRRRTDREFRYEPDASEWEILDPVSPQYDVFPNPTALSPPPLTTEYVEPAETSTTLFNWVDVDADLSAGPIQVAAAEAEDGPSAANAASTADDVLASDALTEPPATLDRASPAPATTARSRSSSPNEASRAWLAEYQAHVPMSSGSFFTLGRRRREDEPGPSSRRRLRHAGERDTRRDAIIFSPGPESWLDNMISREGGSSGRPDPLGMTGASVTSNVGSTSRSGSTADDGAAAAEDEVIVIGDERTHTHTPDVATREQPPLSRTMSLSAVGRGDRPVAPLPRRRPSMLASLE